MPPKKGTKHSKAVSTQPKAAAEPVAATSAAHLAQPKKQAPPAVAAPPPPAAREILPPARRTKLIDNGLASFSGSTVTYIRPSYSDSLLDQEEQVRADFYLDLVERHGYSDPKAIRFEVLHKIGHPHKKTDAKIDILVRHPDERPFMLVELKSPDEYDRYMEDSLKTQVFNVAAVENQKHKSLRYIVYYTRYWAKGALVEKVVCIDYARYKSFDEWHAAGRPNLRTVPNNYAITVVPKLMKGTDRDLRTDATREELQRIRHDLHNILWGGGKYQNELEGPPLDSGDFVLVYCLHSLESRPNAGPPSP